MKLPLETPGPSVVDLLPESQTTFFVPGMPLKVKFVGGESGRVERLDVLDILSGTGATTSAQRLPSE